MANSGQYFESVEKLLLLNLTGDTTPYSDKASNNFLHHVFPGVGSCEKFEFIFATKSLMTLSILPTIFMHGCLYNTPIIKGLLCVV